MQLPKRWCIPVLQYNLLPTKLFPSHPHCITKTHILLFRLLNGLTCRLDNYPFMMKQCPICIHRKNITISIPSFWRILHPFHGVSKTKSMTLWKVFRYLKWKTAFSRISASFRNATSTGTLLELLHPFPIQQTKNPSSLTQSTVIQPIKALTLCLLLTRTIPMFASDLSFTHRILSW